MAVSRTTRAYVAVAFAAAVCAGLAAAADYKAEDDAAASGMASNPGDDPVSWGQHITDRVCGPQGLGQLCGSFRDTVVGNFKKLDSLGESTSRLLYVQVLEDAAEAAGKASGFEADKIKYLLCLFASYPLAIVFAMLPGPTAKHLFSLASGLFMAVYVLHAGWIHSFITATAVYIFLFVTQSVRALDASRPLIVLFVMMAYMSFSHLYRVFDDYLGWSLDFTGPQMLLTIKLTAFAFNLHDGTTDKGKAAAFKIDEKDAKYQGKGGDRKLKGDQLKAKMLADRAARSISELPSLLEYYSWVYCFASYLAGPAFEIREYLDAINGDAYKGKGGDGKMPTGRFGKALKCFLLALLFLGGMVVGGAKFPISALMDPKLALAKPLPLRIGHAWLTLFLVRFKYYFGWLIAEGAAVLAGFGATPGAKDGDNWGGASNIEVVAFETAQNISAGSRAWNKFTQRWLERYVYRRTGNSLAATYFMSAFWHGFYPGYYLFFMSVPLATNVGRDIRRKVRPYFDGTSLKPIYDIVSVVLTSLAMNYLASAFQALALDYAIFVWSSYLWSGHIIMVVLYVGLMLMPTPKAKKD